MASIVNGYLTEQKVVTVSNTDLAINNEIAAQATGSWLVQDLFISGSNVILLFQRTTQEAL